MTAGDRAEMTWIIERTLAEGDLEEIVAIEAASFSNPWTRQMYLRELQNPDVSFLYVLRVAVEGGGRSHRIAGFCSFWLVLDEIHINNLAIRPRIGAGGSEPPCCGMCCRLGADRGRARHAQCGAPTRPPAGSTRASASRWPPPGRIITPARRKMRLSYGRAR